MPATDATPRTSDDAREIVRVWAEIRREAAEAAHHEPTLATYFHATVLAHERFEEALAFVLAGKLTCPVLDSLTLRDVMIQAYQADPDIAASAVIDLIAVRDRDPACAAFCYPFLFFKGWQAIQCYRVAHALWLQDRRWLALHIQSRMSECFGVDIHPAARIGRGVMIDHATSVVIGETAVVEDDVSILHEVTLGGTGKACGDRHPKVRRGSLLAAGAKIFGNIEIGEGAKVAGGSVVLTSVAPHTTVAGVPAKAVGKPRAAQPSTMMDQSFAGDYLFIGEGI